MKKNLIILAVISTICFSSCSVGRIKNLEIQPEHAIIIAKLDIIKGGNTYLSNKWDIAWNNSTKYFANCDSNGYVYMMLPIQKNSITNLYYKDEVLKFPPDLFSVNLVYDKIYYIGDIKINWDSLEVINNRLLKSENVTATRTMGAVFGGAIGGAIAWGVTSSEENKNHKVEENTMIVVDNYVETVKYFKKLFPTDQIIQKALLEVKTEYSSK